MKQLYMNNGLLHEVDNELQMPPGVEEMLQDLIANGRMGRLTSIHSSDGYVVNVLLKTDKTAATIDLSKDGILLSESLVMPRNEHGKRQWQSFKEHFEAHICAGRITANAAGLRCPGCGPWAALIVHPVNFQCSDAELGWREKVRMFLAEGYVRR